MNKNSKCKKTLECLESGFIDFRKSCEKRGCFTPPSEVEKKNMKEKYYTVYTIYDVERGCGCEESRHMDIYDSTGNHPKKFKTYKEADNAGYKSAKERGDERWNVQESRSDF